MVQPVVNEMFATVHAAGSSLLGLFIHSLRVQPSIRHMCVLPAKKKKGVAESKPIVGSSI
eukprot:scaffold12888_cov144-Isochrysis_galbana.AAC.2